MRNNRSTYDCWNAMKRRCFNKKHKWYRRYGGRGISVCERWLDFDNFKKDMGFQPKGMSLERINNDGNYEPSNCKWATMKEQSLNRVSTRWITYQGKTLCISDWAAEAKISPFLLYARLKKMPFHLALTTEFGCGNKRWKKAIQ